MMDGMGMGGGGNGLTVVLLVLVWIVTAAAMYAAGYLTARHGTGSLTGRHQDDSVALLRRRLAAGEIDDEQYLRLLSTMESR